MTTLSATPITTIGAPGSDKVPMSTKEWPVLVNDETCDVPVCTNDAALAAGDELVLFKPEKAKPKAKPKAAKTWMQEKDAVDCARAAKKPRQ